MPRTNPDSEENIRRIDSAGRKAGSGGTHGFQVHFNRSQTNYTRLFSDAPCGGKEKARKLAREFREVLRDAIPKSKNGPSRVGPSRSNTGHMGVSITGATANASSGTLLVEATVRIAKGKPVNKKFHVRDLSELRSVIREAVAWREAILRERIAREQANAASEA